MKLFCNNSLKGALFVIAAGMCYGTSGTIQAFTPDGASSLTVGSARIFSAAILLCVWAAFRGWRRVFNKDWRFRGVLLSALGQTCYQLSFFSAVRLAGIAIGTMVAIGSAPVIVGVIGRIFFKERLTRRWFIATPAAVFGCVLLAAAGNSDFSSVSLMGVFLALCAALSYACQGLGLRIIGNRDSLDTVTLIMTIGGVLALPCLIIGDISWVAEPRGIICVLLLACVTTILPCVLFAKGVRLITLGRAYTLSLSEPLTACILSICLVGETLSLAGIIGVALILAGVLLLAGDN